ncbi:SgcJ/EcaC family oxidoreductase [Flavobacterium chungbukense]|uniref:SnoaL-like domain-containing protein n=1 Tax=Flavobacterium chungbukense TaxID=877464 RepID=A0ABP7XW27_9FLAO|nr:SgcJ/EcaC family oxidoreductase [Flavobacterium chungbukense]MCC4921728.1 SgcJ/EcaC family oxidoreductase [Flavobacterium chungbukense]
MKALYLFVFVCSATIGFAQNKDEVLQKIIKKQEVDWNKNDMKSFSEAFSEDAVLINFLGMYWKGKEEIITQFSHINDCCIKPTTVKLDWIDSKFLSENAAVAHIKETLTAKEDYAVPGGIVKKGTVNSKFITAVFEKNNAVWKIVSMQVTQLSAPPK